MFVRITDGVSELEVSEGAFDNIYSKQGFKKVAEKIQVNSENVEEDNISELEEKPLSQWTKTDMLDYAKKNGIDITGTKNANEAREIIRAFQVEQEVE